MTTEKFAQHRIHPTIFIAILWVLWWIFPYMMAWLWGEQHQMKFSGFLFNPEDNLSYLAKMWQGYEGEWCYRLIYTARPVSCQPVFMYYLFLGHLARLLDIPFLSIYHIARIFHGISLFIVLVLGIRRIIDNEGLQILGLFLALFSAGIGWIYLPLWLPNLPPDFNLADTFIYLSAINAPHFLLSHTINILLLSFLDTLLQRWYGKFIVVILYLVNTFVLPFSSILLLSSWLLKIAFDRRWRDFVYFIPSLLSLIYPIILKIRLSNDIFWRAWQQQNVTLSPPIWSLFLALSPFLPLSIYGFIHQKQSFPPPIKLMYIYCVVSFFLGYFPTPVQRRFFLTLHPVVVFLAVFSLEQVQNRYRCIRVARYIKSMLLTLSLPVIPFTLIGYFILFINRPDVFFLTRGEVESYQWIQTHLPKNAVFISSPSTGLRLAAFTGRRVIIGHHMETPYFQYQRELIFQFLCKGRKELIASYYEFSEDVYAYIFMGPRERYFCGNNIKFYTRDNPIYANAEVTIYKLSPKKQQSYNTLGGEQ